MTVRSSLRNPALCALLLAIALWSPRLKAGERYVTANFDVTAPTAELARQVALAAEEHRNEFARRWFNKEITDWPEACQITLVSHENAAMGWTSYQVLPSSVGELQILLKGPAPRLLEFVLPHEVAHAVLVKSLERPLPRWADEGIALTCESEAQQRRLRLQAAYPHSPTRLEELLDAREYPAGDTRLHRFYTHSYLLTEFLLTRGEEQQLIAFASDGQTHGWENAACRHYGVSSLDELQDQWQQWLSSSLAMSSSEQVARAPEAAP
jgi:hypothetical protein